MDIPFYVNAKFLQEEQCTGVGRYAWEIAIRLHRAFPHVPFLAPKTVPKKWHALVPLRTIGTLRGAAWEQIELARYLRDKCVPVLNLASTAPVAYPRNVLMVHDIFPLTHPDWYSWRARLYFSLLLPQCIRRCAALMTVSEQTKTEILRLFSQRRAIASRADTISVVPAAAGDFWAPDPSPNAEGRYVLAVSSHDPRKNFLMLIRAFRLLEDPTLRLLIVGKPHKAFRSMEISKMTTDRIVFTGYLPDPDVRRLYTHAQAFLFPSLAEGFGIPPLEGMRCGCPIIASDIPVLRAHYGDAAVYVCPHNPTAMAVAIHRVLSDPSLRQSLIIKGRQRASEFDWEDSVSRILAVLRTTMEEPYALSCL